MKEFTQDWIERLKKGEEEAFRFFYQLYANPLWIHLIKMLGDEESARDALQETFVLVVKKLDFYQSRSKLENSFRSWVYRVATNRAIDELRKRKKGEVTGVYEEAPSHQDPAEILSEEQTARTLQRLIFTLPPKQRTFLNLKVNEEMNYKEIADICGCNVNTVKQGIFRARASLKVLLKKEGELV